MVLLALCAAGLLGWTVLACVRRPGRAGRRAVDEPTPRSLHERAGRGGGGGGVGPGGLLGGVLWVQPMLGLGMLMLAAVSFWDDRHGLAARTRFAVHVAVAALWLGYVLPAAVMPSPWGWALLPVLVWGMNLYNFMDGADGLAGGMAVSGFGALAVAAGMAGDVQLAVAGGALAGAAAGFLCFNLHPARVFLGDSGSVPCGFAMAALGLEGWMRGLWTWWFPLLVFAPFVADATFTLLRRMLRGERFWEAHRGHYYQRMVRSGCGHRYTARLAYALMLMCAAGGLLALHGGGWVRWGTIALLVTALVSAALWIDRRWVSIPATPSRKLP